MNQAIRDSIVQAAEEAGMDPSLALAIAERESSFNPSARNSSTIRGLYQMQGGHRARYGIGDSDDPRAQTKGWAAFFRDVQKEMAGPLGRDPTDAEGYLGHHFGGARAGRMLKMDPNTPVDMVFNPREMAENPHFGKAGTVGALNSSILADIGKRQAKFGGGGPVDFGRFGEPVEGIGQAEPIDFASTANPVENINMGSAPAASSAPDFSNFGVAV